MNPIGANTWIWVSPLTDERLARLAPRVRDFGFDVIELPIENAGDWDPGRARELLDEVGLMAARAGARTLAGPIYSPVGKTWPMDASERATTVRRLVENLRPVADYAAERGVTLALEPLNRFETSFINTAEQVMEVVDRVASPALGVLLDTFHMNIEEHDPAAAIRLCSGHLAHFHACGCDRGAPGSDQIPWPKIVAALRDTEYEGPLVIESFTIENQAIARAAAIWRPLAPTQDAIAADGLRFLKGVLA
jgi:D-psicose/D-tagatose/L-ribulose 3-epimerase